MVENKYNMQWRINSKEAVHVLAMYTVLSRIPSARTGEGMLEVTNGLGPLFEEVLIALPRQRSASADSRFRAGE